MNCPFHSSLLSLFFLPSWCFTSTETVLFTRDGGRMGQGMKAQAPFPLHTAPEHFLCLCLIYCTSYSVHAWTCRHCVCVCVSLCVRVCVYLATCLIICVCYLIYVYLFYEVFIKGWWLNFLFKDYLSIVVLCDFVSVCMLDTWCLVYVATFVTSHCMPSAENMIVCLLDTWCSICLARSMCNQSHACSVQRTWLCEFVCMLDT